MCSFKWIVINSEKPKIQALKKISSIENFRLVGVNMDIEQLDDSFSNVNFLSEEEQKQTFPQLYKLISENFYSRKMFGYLFAIKNGAKFIYDADDNKIHQVDINKHFNYMSESIGLISDLVVTSKNQINVFDPSEPIDRKKFILTKRKASLVQQTISSFQNSSSEINFNPSAPSFQLQNGFFSNLNNRNSLYFYDSFWSLYLPHSVNFQLSEILRSYWSQVLMWIIDGNLEFIPSDSTEINSYQNFKSSYFDQIGKALEFLNKWKCEFGKKFKDCIIALSYDMAKNDFWSINEYKAIEAWLAELDNIGYKFPERVDQKNLNYKKFQVLISAKSNLNNYANVDSIQSLIFSKKCTNFHKLKKRSGNLTNFDHSSNLQNIEYLYAMYYDYFQNVIFCGKDLIQILEEGIQSGNEMFKFISGIELDSHNGYFHYDCMSKVIEINYKTEGILLISDDALIKPWNMRNLDINKIWFYNLNCKWTVNCFHTLDPSYKTAWPWWKRIYGYQGIRHAFDIYSKASLSSALGKAFDRFKPIFEINTNSSFKQNIIHVMHGGSDLFYLPKRHFEAYRELATVMCESMVFLEAAVPITLYGLDKLDDIIHMSSDYNWKGQFSYEKHYDSFLHSYHPAKLSFVEKNATFRNLFCTRFFECERMVENLALAHLPSHRFHILFQNLQDLEQVRLSHPFNGQMSVSDIKLKFNFLFSTTESGRKINKALAEGSKLVNNTGRVFGDAFNHAKLGFNSFFGGWGSGSSDDRNSSKKAKN
ncbi:hypothetical protein BpHYR1_042459 [Brachionus plicatilis]|uniref:Uncharacterized protein n=1 Tax=Brachionus plicatilis TaxID=10195 RepID=A0A3M7S6L1_BRAPC|nr:hypothetical protein BpHYR1_042459 [Brachionus plicatilis]